MKVKINYFQRFCLLKTLKPFGRNRIKIKESLLKNKGEKRKTKVTKLFAFFKICYLLDIIKQYIYMLFILNTIMFAYWIIVNKLVVHIHTFVCMVYMYMFVCFISLLYVLSLFNISFAPYMCALHIKTIMFDNNTGG